MFKTTEGAADCEIQSVILITHNLYGSINEKLQKCTV
jgi:hypothetical protein